jgi:hypothetical protein
MTPALVPGGSQRRQGRVEGVVVDVGPVGCGLLVGREVTAWVSLPRPSGLDRAESPDC